MSAGQIPEAPASTATAETAPAATPLPTEQSSVLHPVNLQPVQNANEQQQVTTLKQELQGHVEASNINGGIQAEKNVEAEMEKKKTGLAGLLDRVLGKKSEQPPLVPAAVDQPGPLWKGQAAPAVQAPVVEQPPIEPVAEPMPTAEHEPVVEPVVAQAPTETVPPVEPVQSGGVLDQANAVVAKAEQSGGSLAGDNSELDRVADTARGDQAIAAAAEQKPEIHPELADLHKHAGAIAQSAAELQQKIVAKSAAMSSAPAASPTPAPAGQTV